MSKTCVIENTFGVKINIRSMTPAVVYQRINSPLVEAYSAPATRSAFVLVWNASAKHLFERTKTIVFAILTFPLLIGRKILKLFEENPYSYPTYPFHFPILIYGEDDPFGYYNQLEPAVEEREAEFTASEPEHISDGKRGLSRE